MDQAPVSTFKSTECLTFKVNVFLATLAGLLCSKVRLNLNTLFETTQRSQQDYSWKPAICLLQKKNYVTRLSDVKEGIMLLSLFVIISAQNMLKMTWHNNGRHVHYSSVSKEQIKKS